jgi:hypothetical protein
MDVMFFSPSGPRPGRPPGHACAAERHHRADVLDGWAGVHARLRCLLRREVRTRGNVRRLAAEVGPHGINVLIVEPGAFATSSAVPAHRSLPTAATTTTRSDPSAAAVADMDGSQPGDLAKAAAAMLEAVAAPSPAHRRHARRTAGRDGRVGATEPLDIPVTGPPLVRGM